MKSDKPRKYYIDNLRILLTCLVVLHHLAISYGGPGNWYYNEANPSMISTILLTLFVATNQSFFMGMFFMISAFFLEKSMRKKSTIQLVQDKLKRLGIPLVFFAVIISPVILYLLSRFDQGETHSFVEVLQTINEISFGPLWFVEALLIFSLFTILFQSIRGNSSAHTKKKLPMNYLLLLGAIGIALLSFVIRIWMPVGWTLDPFGFQLGHFTQYIVLFGFGFHASKHDWFSQITFQQGKMWLRWVAVMIFILFPVVFYIGGAATEGPEAFMGGATWQSFLFSIWEQVVGIGIIIGLIGIFKEKYNFQDSRLKSLSTSAYTVYIIHALILVASSLLMKEVAISATLKFLLLAPLMLIVCFSLAHLIRKLPLARDIL